MSVPTIQSRLHAQLRLPRVRCVRDCSAFPSVFRPFALPTPRPPQRRCSQALFSPVWPNLTSRVAVHHRLRLLAFPVWASPVPRLVRPEISRFPCKERTHMPGLRPRQVVRVLALAHPSALPSALTDSVGTWDRNFRGSIAGLCVPRPTLHRHPHGCRCTARGQWGSLLLHCSGLAPPTPCRSPGAPVASFRISFSSFRRLFSAPSPESSICSGEMSLTPLCSLPLPASLTQSRKVCSTNPRARSPPLQSCHP